MPTRSTNEAKDDLLPIHPLLWRGFSLIARRRIRGSFRAMRIANLSRFPLSLQRRSEPLILYVNHPSWWDPLVSIVLSPRLVGKRSVYTPIDAMALERYGILRRLGLFPVQPNTPRGAVQFLRAADAVLARGDVLALTPQGHFTDVRQRPPGLKAGLHAVVERRSRAGLATTVVPFAVEYTFWNQRLPEVLLNVGAPMRIAPGDDLPGSAFEEALARTQDELATLSALRDESVFRTLLDGSAGATGFYGLWQRLTRRATAGAGTAARHGDADHAA